MRRMIRVKYENKSDLEDEDHVEVHSEDLDTKQDISSEESEDEFDVNEKYVVFFFFNDKESKWNKNPVRRQIRKQPQKMLCQLPLVRPNTNNTKTELDTWHLLYHK